MTQALDSYSLAALPQARADLIHAMADHARECARPISSTDAVRTYARYEAAHGRLAHILASCPCAMSDQKRTYLGWAGPLLVAEADVHAR